MRGGLVMKKFFEDIHYSMVDKADDAMQHASGDMYRSRVEYPPFFEEAVAAASIVLEKNYPHIFRENEDNLNSLTPSGSMFLDSAVRTLNYVSSLSAKEYSPETSIGIMVSSMVNTREAKDILAVTERMKAEDISSKLEDFGYKVLSSADADRIMADKRLEARGAYNRISPERQEELGTIFKSMSNLSPVARSDISRASEDISQMQGLERSRSGYTWSRIADFKEAGEPLFGKGVSDPGLEKEATDRIRELAMNTGKPATNEIEKGLKAHMEATISQPHDPVNYDSTLAGIMRDRARTVIAADFMSPEILHDAAMKDADLASPLAVATKVESLAQLMINAEKKIVQAGSRDYDVELLAQGRLSEMTAQSQIEVTERMSKREGVAPYLTMKMSEALRDMSAMDRSMQTQMESAEPKIGNKAYGEIYNASSGLAS